MSESQIKKNHAMQSKDLFEAIKGEMKDCNTNHFTSRVCALCDSNVSFEINDDNWYLLGIAYGLKYN